MVVKNLENGNIDDDGDYEDDGSKYSNNKDNRNFIKYFKIYFYFID